MLKDIFYDKIKKTTDEVNSMSFLKSILKNPELKKELDTMNAPQRVALIDILLGHSVLISGSGGVGKSRLIHAIKKMLPHVTISASTGVAGMQIHGRTIDSLMGFSVGTDFESCDVDIPASLASKIAKYETLVIDEASMVRIDKIEAINRRLQYIFGNSKPFGGIQVIIIFDMMQTPPVLKRNDREGQEFLSKFKDKLFFFESPIIDLTYFKVHVLDQNMRNAHPEQVRILRNFRMGHNLTEVVEFINDNVKHISYQDAIDSHGKPLLCRTNAQVVEFNRQTYEKLKSPELIYKGRFTGDYPQTQSELPAEFDLRLKVGASVMMLINNMADGYVNGDVGIIERLDKDSILVRTKRETLVRVTPHVWDYFNAENDPEKPSGTYSQFPLRLAYAFTAHKCQGMTLHTGSIVDYSGMNDFGTTYVMSSRTTDLKDMELLRPIQIKDIKVSTKCRDFTLKISMDALARRASDIKECERLIQSAMMN